MAEKRIYSGARCYTFSEAMIERVTGGESRRQPEEELVRQFTELYGFVDYGSRKDFLEVYRARRDKETDKKGQSTAEVNEAEEIGTLPHHWEVCERCPEIHTHPFPCEYWKRFLSVRYLTIQLKENASRPKENCKKCMRCSPEEDGTSSVKLHDVRLNGYPTVVEVQRTKYVSGTRRGIRCNMPPINGLQRTNHDKTTNRLIAAMVCQNLSCHMPRLVAEGYGISTSTVVAYSRREYKRIEKRKANLRLQQNANAIVMDHTAFTVRGKTYNAYVQMKGDSGSTRMKSELVGIYKDYEMAYFESLRNGSTDTGRRWDMSATSPECIQALAYDYAALWSSPVKAPPAVYALTIMICDVVQRDEYFYKRKRKMRDDVQRILHEVTEAECTVGQLRDLAVELFKYPQIHAAAEQLRDHLEEMICARQGISQTKIGHLTNKDPSEIELSKEKDSTGEHAKRHREVIESVAELASYMEESYFSFEIMRMRMLFFNESVVPFQIVSRNSSDTDVCIPALRDAICFDELKIKSVGIKWPCLMHLLKTGLLDQERMGLQPCKAARMNQRYQSHGGQWRTLWESGQLPSGIFEDCPNECPELEENIRQQ